MADSLRHLSHHTGGSQSGRIFPDSSDRVLPRNTAAERDMSRLGEATDIAAEAIAQRFGRGAVDGKIQAHIISIET